MRRREFLKRLAAAGLLVGTAGCQSNPTETSDAPTQTAPTTDLPRRSPTSTQTATATRTDAPSPTETPETSAEAELRRRYADRFDSVVDVTDAGADPDGERPVDDALADAAANDTLVFFPDGTYKLRTFRLSDAANVGFVAAPSATPTVVPAAAAADLDGPFVQFTGVADLLIDGVDFDFRGVDRGGTPLVYVQANGDFALRDLRVRGAVPRDSIGLMFEVIDESASGLVNGVDLRDGGHPGGDSVGIYVGQEHAGEIYFEDCRVAQFPNNGLYASTPGKDEGGGGGVHVRSGTYANNNISNVRIGSDGSTVRDATIVMDRVPPHDPMTLLVRGIRIRRGRDHLVENCRLEIGEDAGDGYGGIVHHTAAGPASVRDTEVSIERDGMHAIDVGSDGGGQSSVPGGPVFRNVRVDGTASGGPAVFVRNRGHSAFHDCTVRQSGADRDGFVFDSTSNCVVVDSDIAVTGEPIRRKDANVQTRNVETTDLDDPSGDSGDEKTTTGGSALTAARRSNEHIDQ